MEIPNWITSLNYSDVPYIMARLHPDDATKMVFIEENEFRTMMQADTAEWYPVYSHSMQRDHGPLTYSRFFSVLHELVEENGADSPGSYMQHIAQQFSGFDFGRDAYRKGSIGNVIWLPVNFLKGPIPNKGNATAEQTGESGKRKPWLL